MKMIKNKLSLSDKAGLRLRVQAFFTVATIEYTGYLIINHFNEWRWERYGHHIEPWTSIDRAIPFVPFFMIPYLLLIPLLAVPLVVVKSDKRTKRGVEAYFGVILTSFLIFVLIPMKMDRSEYVEQIPESGIVRSAVEWLWSIDLPYNTFPSLHISLVCIAAMIIYNERKIYGILMILGATMLTISTFLAKQHFIVDAIGGIILAWIWFKYYYLNKIESI